MYGKDATAMRKFPAEVELSSLNGSNGFRINGERQLTYAGSSVSAAGDINGDGIDDLIIGAPDYEGGENGFSYLVFGGNLDVDDDGVG